MRKTLIFTAVIAAFGGICAAVVALIKHGETVRYGSYTLRDSFDDEDDPLCYPDDLNSEGDGLIEFD